MVDWALINFANVGEGLLWILFLVLGALGARQGLKAKPEKTTTDAFVAGGIVDNSALNKLTDAIVERNSQNREDRKLGHDMVEAIERLAKEVSEMRYELARKRN